MDDFNLDNQRILITMSLLQAVEDSNYTSDHSLRVGRLVRKVGKLMGYSGDELITLTRAAYFHDVGKIKLNKEILFKNDELTNEDFIEMKKHPSYGYDILIDLGLVNESDIVLQHHELLDGSGYPYGLSGDDIMIQSQILTVIDVFDAMCADRPYRDSLKKDSVLLYLYNNSNIKFNYDVVKVLHSVLVKDGTIKDTINI